MRSLLAATLLSAIAASALATPPDAPNRTFQGRDLFALQMATDPQIRPDGREIAYVRVSFDIMADRGRQSIWLIDADSGEQRPLVAAARTRSRAGRRTPIASRMCRPRMAAGRSCSCAGCSSGQTAKITDLTEAPGSLKWSPDGKWIAFTMFAPDEKARLGEAPPKPEGADWAPPLELITKMVYRTDGEGYLKPGYTHIYVVSADGGAPRQLTFGAYNEDGPISWTPDGKYVVVTGNRHENWEREPVNSEVYRVALADGAIEELTKRNGPDRAADISPDGKSIAYPRLRRQVPRLPERRAERDGPRRQQLALAHCVARSHDRRCGLGARRTQPLRAVRRPRERQGRARLAQRQDGNGRRRSRRRLARPSVHGRSVHCREQRRRRIHQGFAAAADRNRDRARRQGATADASQRRLPDRQDARPGQAAEGDLVVRSARHRRVDRHAAELRRQQEVSADPGNPRRTVRGLRAAVLDRLSAVRRRRLRGAVHQSARLDLLRPGIREPDSSQLSEPGLRRPDERRRRRDRAGLRRRGQSVRHRRLGRRRADRVDRRQDDALQGGRDAEAGDQLDQRRC